MLIHLLLEWPIQGPKLIFSVYLIFWTLSTHSIMYPISDACLSSPRLLLNYSYPPLLLLLCTLSPRRPHWSSPFSARTPDSPLATLSSCLLLLVLYLPCFLSLTLCSFPRFQHISPFPFWICRRILTSSGEKYGLAKAISQSRGTLS